MNILWKLISFMDYKSVKELKIHPIKYKDVKKTDKNFRNKIKVNLDNSLRFYVRKL